MATERRASLLSLVLVMSHMLSLEMPLLLAARQPCSVKYHRGTYSNFLSLSVAYREGCWREEVRLLAFGTTGGNCRRVWSVSSMRSSWSSSGGYCGFWGAGRASGQTGCMLSARWRSCLCGSSCNRWAHSWGLMSSCSACSCCGALSSGCCCGWPG